jgi:hypothetical protein
VALCRCGRSDHIRKKEDIEGKVKHTVCPYTRATPLDDDVAFLSLGNPLFLARTKFEKMGLQKKASCKTFSGHFSVRRPHSHRHASAVPAAAAAAARVLNDPRRRTMAGGSGKKARGRANKANKKGEAATPSPAPPPPPPPPPPPAAAPSSSDEPPEQQVPQPDEATAALPHASDRAALVNRLQTFAENAKMGMRGDIRSWVASVFSGDWAAVAAAAEGGDAEAQHLRRASLTRKEATG